MVDFYAINLVNGMYVMVHIGQATVPASLKEMLYLYFVDDIEVFLGIKEVFIKSFDTFYNKISNPSLPSKNAKFKRPPQNSTSLSAEREIATELVWTF